MHRASEVLQAKVCQLEYQKKVLPCKMNAAEFEKSSWVGLLQADVTWTSNGWSVEAATGCFTPSHHLETYGVKLQLIVIALCFAVQVLCT